MNVVQNQKRAGIEMRVEEVVFEVGERVGVGSVEQGELEFLNEAMPWQRLLRGAFDEGHAVRAEQGERRTFTTLPLLSSSANAVWIFAQV